MLAALRRPCDEHNVAARNTMALYLLGRYADMRVRHSKANNDMDTQIAEWSEKRKAATTRQKILFWTVKLNDANDKNRRRWKDMQMVSRMLTRLLKQLWPKCNAQSIIRWCVTLAKIPKFERNYQVGKQTCNYRQLSYFIKKAAEYPVLTRRSMNNITLWLRM
ncbi:hypothetical protein OAM67_01370 [bacterium]|nr:hypothetical protein [bacterium]